MVFKMINLFISLIFFIYFLFLQIYLLTQYIKKNISNKLNLVYWIDYNIMILFLLLASIYITFDLYINGENDKDLNSQVLYSNNYFPLLFESNLIVNIIISFQLLLKIKRMKTKYKHFDIKKMKKFIKKVDIMNIYKTIPHLIIIFSTNLLITLIIFYSDYFMEKENKLLFINLIHIFLFFSNIIIVLILSNRNKSLIGHQIYFKNNLVEKLYNNNKIKLVASIEHLLNKFIFDLLLTIPCIIKIFYNLNILVYFYSFIFSGFLYLFFFGAMLLSIDSANFTLIPCTLKFLFCTKHFNFYFGDGKKIISKIFEPDNIDIFNYNTYFNKSKIFNSQEDFINKLNGINGYSETTISSLFEGNEILTDTFEDNINKNDEQNKKIDEKIKEVEKQMIKKEKEYGPCNFFIIFKLIYLYYNTNIEYYNKIQKSAEEDGFFTENNLNSNKIKYSPQKINGRITYSRSTNNLKSNINNIKEKINTLNKSQYNQLISYKIFNINEIMGNIQEYNMKTIFIKYLSKNFDKINESKKNNNYNLNQKGKINEFDFSISFPSEIMKDSRITKNTIKSMPLLLNDNENNYNDDSPSLYEFKIESLMNNDLIDLFPFYEINVNDILNSLDVNNNMHLFDIFFWKKNDDKNFNSYYTYDSFLNLEIYDNKFLSYDQLKLFINNYKTYILDKISNFGFTFLPLIIGIFNISYLSYNKIIFLLKNPLAFTPDFSFHYWLKFIFCEESEKMESSTNNNEIADINEIEAKNNLKLNKEEYLDAIKILDSDFKFLNNANFNLDYKLNLFILNNDQNSNYEDNIINNQENINNNNKDKNENINENANLMNIIRNTDLFPGNNSFGPYNFKKKFYGSESISFLENLYISDLDDNNYIFKIYFSEIFKKKNIDNKSKNNEKNNNGGRNSQGMFNNQFTNFNNVEAGNEIQENNQNLCKNIKAKILKMIGKSENNIFEE